MNMPTVTIKIAGRGTPLADTIIAPGTPIEGKKSKTGHMWYSLDDGNGNTHCYGFAPGPDFEGHPFAPGEVHKDDDTKYLSTDFTTTIEITQKQYDAMKNFGEHPEADFYLFYRGATNSCIDFTWKALEIANLNPSGFEGFIWPLWNSIALNFPNTISPTTNDSFTAAQRWFQPRRDPLTLDLDGDGIETVAVSATNPVMFDHDGDGVKSGTGWIKGDDGFLVLDRDDNGTIDNGTELFGDSTPLSAGGLASDGFAALADQDTNKDGKVDTLDTNWNALRVWRDLNQDGISQAEELSTLESVGIAAFNTGKTEHSQVLANGNQIADLGTYIKTDGTLGSMGEVGGMADVDLAEDTFHTEFTDTLPIAPEAELLPDMQGAGKLRDLREATSQSSYLTGVLAQYSQAAA